MQLFFLKTVKRLQKFITMLKPKLQRKYYFVVLIIYSVIMYNLSYEQSK